jgi:hypothetical protein
LPTAKNDAELGAQESLTLNSLKRLAPREGSFEDLPMLVAAPTQTK